MTLVELYRVTIWLVRPKTLPGGKQKIGGIIFVPPLVYGAICSKLPSGYNSRLIFESGWFQV
jgi:hypothetical protein